MEVSEIFTGQVSFCSCNRVRQQFILYQSTQKTYDWQTWIYKARCISYNFDNLLFGTIFFTAVAGITGRGWKVGWIRRGWGGLETGFGR